MEACKGSHMPCTGMDTLIHNELITFKSGHLIYKNNNNTKLTVSTFCITYFYILLLH